MMITSALVVTLGLVLAPGDLRESNPHFAEAEVAFRAGRWDDAARAFAEAHAQDPRPEYLYAQAQAERIGGRCERALETYRRFLAEDPPGQAAADARANMQKCETVVPVTPIPVDAPREPRHDDAVASATNADEDVGPAPSRAPAAAPRWYRDAWGGVLTWTGVALAGTGAVLVGEAHRRRRGARAVENEQAYREVMGQAPLMSRIGIGLLVGGSALLVAGITRYAVVGKSRARTRAQRKTQSSRPVASFSVSLRAGIGLGLRW